MGREAARHLEDRTRDNSAKTEAGLMLVRYSVMHGPLWRFFTPGRECGCVT